MHKFSKEFTQAEAEAQIEYLCDLCRKLNELEEDFVKNCRQIAGRSRGNDMLKVCRDMVKQMLKNTEDVSF